MKIVVLFLIMILTIIAGAYPNEFEGIVTSITNGTTFNVSGLGCVRLADINTFSPSSWNGIKAREFTRDQLMGIEVFLDLDNKTGKDLTVVGRSWLTRLIPTAL